LALFPRKGGEGSRVFALNYQEPSFGQDEGRPHSFVTGPFLPSRAVEQGNRQADGTDFFSPRAEGQFWKSILTLAHVGEPGELFSGGEASDHLSGDWTSGGEKGSFMHLGGIKGGVLLLGVGREGPGVDRRESTQLLEKKKKRM